MDSSGHFAIRWVLASLPQHRGQEVFCLNVAGKAAENDILNQRHSTGRCIPGQKKEEEAARVLALISWGPMQQLVHSWHLGEAKGTARSRARSFG